MPFADRLRSLRKIAKLTQEQLAHACGYAGQSRIGNYESGAREPTLDELPALAHALGAPIGALLDDAELSAFEAGDARPRQSHLTRQDAENIVAAIDGLRRQGSELTAESFEVAYWFVVDRANSQAAASAITKLPTVTSDVTKRRRGQGTGETPSRPTRRGSK